MSKGTVKFFNQERGFGFIAPDHGGNGIFVHATCVKDSVTDLEQGDVVEYGEDTDRSGRPRAINVRRVG